MWVFRQLPEPSRGVLSGPNHRVYGGPLGCDQCMLGGGHIRQDSEFGKTVGAAGGQQQQTG